ncbi:MAG: hypothetical protein H0U92_12765 [Actinobacteria bacterium]|nr:hypothetical protein [Actinomycetota bacterium]
MSNLIYLGLAAIVTAVGCTIIWLRQRKSTGVDTGIDAFRRELQALAPDRDEVDPRGGHDEEDGRPG